MNTQKQYKIGILGCSTIAPFSIINPVRELDQFVTYGVASRDVDRSAAYALKHQIPHVFESYDKLLASPDIDVVYIPLSNFLHKEWTLKAIEAGKHVLIEKPIALHADEVLFINERARQQDVHVLEALMVQHHSWQQDITDMITAETYGKLKKSKPGSPLKFCKATTARIITGSSRSTAAAVSSTNARTGCSLSKRLSA